MTRVGVITDEFWAAVSPLLPVPGETFGRPWADHRKVLEGICWRYRTGSPWRDVPADFGPWQTLWKRHHRWSTDGTYRRMLGVVAGQSRVGNDEVALVGGLLSVDSSVVRAHHHAAGARRGVGVAEARSTVPPGAGGTVE